jgi:hypothetical protein
VKREAVVWKHVVDVGGTPVELPWDSAFLTGQAEFQGSDLVVWSLHTAEADEYGPKRKGRLFAVATGQWVELEFDPVPKYVGTATSSAGFVLHVFYEGEPG